MRSNPSLTTRSTGGAAVEEPGIDALFADDVAVDGPGAAVGIYHRGELVLAKGFGLADLESGQPITPQTPFHVASVSKQFTAFAIALLAWEGAIDLDADVRDYLPYVPDFGDTISLRHLIFHTSGLRNHLMLLQLGGQSVDGRITQQQIVNLVARQQRLNFPPGTDYAYSNTGYTLLAEIVYRATGQTLRQFATERIFAPLRMERTFFLDDVTEIVPRRANSYTKRRDQNGQEHGGWARAPLNTDYAGPGSLLTTVADLTGWARNFVDPVVGDEALIEQVCTSGTLDDGTAINYAFGLERGDINGRVAVSHTGSDAAFRSVFAHFPEHDFAVAILANTELALTKKVGAIADRYLPAVTATHAQAPAPDTGADLSRFVGTYLPAHGTSLRLEVRDDALVCHSGRGEPQKLVVRIDGTLDFGSPGGQSLIPVVDAAGQVIGLSGRQVGYGHPVHLQRDAVPEAPPTDLAEYAGDYRSPELDITYSLNVQDGTLMAEHLWSNLPLALSPVVPDRFESPGDRSTFALKMIPVFQRDPEGRIEGLQMHTAGDRNIHFDRVGDARPPAPAASIRAWGTWG